LLFGVGFSTSIEPRIFSTINHTPFGDVTFREIYPVAASIFPLSGLIVALIGVCWRGNNLASAPEKGNARTMTTSQRLMLLGIVLLFFGIVFPGSVEQVILRPLDYRIFDSSPAVTSEVLASLFPMAGLVVALVGFFRRDTPSQS
jgi:hypothetical protein